jgi:5-methylcytosine-specific restriction endonuclease McrA
MAFNDEQLNRIYDRTSGYCHICHKKLAFKNYGCNGTRGAWHVEHSRARSKGGTDHLNNLYAACIDCNLEKGTVTTPTARGWHDKSRAPLSPDKRKAAKRTNAAAGASLCGLAGTLLGPWGAVGGAVLGGIKGYKKNPDK